MTFDTTDIIIADEQATSETDIILHYWVEFRPEIGDGYEALSAWSSRPSGATNIYGQLRVPGTPTSDPNWLRGVMLHEIGHTFNLDDVSGISVMGNVARESNTITSCDSAKLRTFYCPSPTPTPTPYPTPDFPGGCSNAYENFQQGSCPLYFSSDNTGYWCCEVGCSYQAEEHVWDPSGYGELDCDVCQDGIDNDCGDGGADNDDYDCAECYPSPLVIDTLGNGFDLTGPGNGVNFDIRGIGRPVRVAWIQGDDAWLVLDRNGNGTIDSGKELFGNVTYQLTSSERNGFRALAVYDETANGGNGDGAITSQDPIYPNLRLWFDLNRNGVSEQSELQTLASNGIAKLELNYRLSKRKDANGNEFRFRSKVKGVDGAQLGRWAWDVFLTSETQTSRNENLLMREVFASNLNIFGFKKSGCGAKVPV